MDDTMSLETFVPDNVLQPLLVASGSSALNVALDRLIETAKTSDGRSDLASKGIARPALELCRYLSNTLREDLLLSSLKLLRNLCAGEIRNQDLFIEDEAVGVLVEICRSVGLASGSGNGMIRMLVQLLGNVVLAGEKHQLAIWRCFFPNLFLEIARIQDKEICDPLCMVMYTCSGGSDGLRAVLLAESGQNVVVEIIRTATVAGFKEDWLKLLLSGICFEDGWFSSVFSKLFPVVDAEKRDGVLRSFGAEQAFLINITSEILNERVADVVVSSDFSAYVLGTLQHAVQIVDFTVRAKSNLPTGSADTDVLGYCLTILRDICACSGPVVSTQAEKKDATEMLLSAGLIELLITLLRDLEPPAIIRKAMAQSKADDGTTTISSKFCPYKGFRRDIVAVVGNCCYRRKNVQDKIREQEGIVLLLQQCVIDEENPFLREWGMWAVHNLLEGNTENLKLVTELELQGTADVDVPELAQMGLRVEVDPQTRRAKLVNLS